MPDSSILSSDSTPPLQGNVQPGGPFENLRSEGAEMKKLRFCVVFLGLTCFFSARSRAAVHPKQDAVATGDVAISSPTGSSTSPQIHYVATAYTTCAQGVAAIGVYSAPHKLAYQVKGSQLDAIITLAPGSYDTVVQEWDNCHGAAKSSRAGLGPGASLRAAHGRL
jgi:hypothetical protein